MNRYSLRFAIYFFALLSCVSERSQASWDPRRLIIMLDAPLSANERFQNLVLRGPPLPQVVSKRQFALIEIANTANHHELLNEGGNNPVRAALVNCLYDPSPEVRRLAIALLTPLLGTCPDVMAAMIQRVWDRGEHNKLEFIQAVAPYADKNKDVHAAIFRNDAPYIAGTAEALITHFYTDPDIRTRILASPGCNADKWLRSYNLLVNPTQAGLVDLIGKLSVPTNIRAALQILDSFDPTEESIALLVSLVEPNQANMGRYLREQQNRAIVGIDGLSAYSRNVQGIADAINEVRLHAAQMLSRLPFVVTNPITLSRIAKLRDSLPQRNVSTAQVAERLGQAYRQAAPQPVPQDARREFLESLRSHLNLVPTEVPETELVKLLKRAKTPREQTSALWRLGRFDRLSNETLEAVLPFFDRWRTANHTVWEKILGVMTRRTLAARVENPLEVRTLASQVFRGQFQRNHIDAIMANSDTRRAQIGFYAHKARVEYEDDLVPERVASDAVESMNFDSTATGPATDKNIQEEPHEPSMVRVEWEGEPRAQEKPDGHVSESSEDADPRELCYKENLRRQARQGD